MRNIPEDFQKILTSVALAATTSNVEAFLLRDSAIYMLNEQYIIPSALEIALQGKYDFQAFYSSLSQSITVNREILHTDKRYVILVESVYLLDITGCESAAQLVSLEPTQARQLLYNIRSRDFVQPDAQRVARSGKLNRSSLDVESVVALAHLAGNDSEADLPEIEQQRLASVPAVAGFSLTDALGNLLLTRQPGTALRFMRDKFIDGKSWLFERLLELVGSVNVGVSEQSTPDAVLSDKKLDLINVYSEFYLHDRVTPETTELRTKRTNSALRLLFDAPSLGSEQPYIDSVSVLMAPTSQETVKLMEIGDDCPYPPCDCNPEKCGETGEPCCCCHSIDVVSAVKIHCHKRIELSCDSTGERPAPDEDPFAETCSHCYEGCASVLQKEVHGVPVPSWNICSQDASELPDWWHIVPPTPCKCHCAQTGSSGCKLSCVTCEGPNSFCQSDVKVSGYDCNYTFALTPTPACCGPTPYASLVFAIDDTGSMSNEIEATRNGVISIVNKLASSGAAGSFSLTTFKDATTTFHWDDNGKPASSGRDYTHDVAAFTGVIGNLVASGGGDTPENLYEGIAAGLSYNLETGRSLGLVAVTDAPAHGPFSVDAVVTQATAIGAKIFYIGPLNGNQDMATRTGGKFWNINTVNWDDVFLEIAAIASSLPASCECLDQRPIYLRQDLTTHPWCDCHGDPTGLSCQDDLWRTHPDCFLFPIQIRKVGDPASQCKKATTVYACGYTVSVTPDYANEVCCSQLTLDNGSTLGCTCPADPPPSCCGPHCVEICDSAGGSFFDTVEAAQEAVWERCIETRVGGSSTDDCLLMRAADGTTYEVCKDAIDQQTADWYWKCFWPPAKPNWKCEEAKCDYTDECIIPHPHLPLSDNQCPRVNQNTTSGPECASVQNPSVVVLNNGIGLVAYESLETPNKIKIQQFKTSARHKLMPNRTFNFGRLQNRSKWERDTTLNLYVAKLFASDPLPVSLIGGTASPDPDDPTTWRDVVSFKTGPLRGLCCPLADPATGNDPALGEFLQFYVTNEPSESFPSSDDVYDVEWFILDHDEDDTKLIGDSSGAGNWQHEELMFTSRQQVDQILLSERATTHIYNGLPVPVARPSIASARNYSNHLENSHHVFLAYQALEDKKWNVYLRQIRLSEYDYNRYRSAATLVRIEDLSEPPVDFTYRLVCSSDKCSEFGDKYLAQRYAIFELLLPDGREVLNSQYVGQNSYWTSLCPGFTQAFPKEKLYVQLIHSVVTHRCPDQFERDELFYQWESGDEFLVSMGTTSPSAIYRSVSNSSASLPLGSFNEPLVVGEISVYSSTVGVTWFDTDLTGIWKVFSDESTTLANTVMGMDVGEPICLTAEDAGHCTRPVVKVNYANEVYVAYEKVVDGITQIELRGTAAPRNVLPVGAWDRRDLDASLDYMLKADDFAYSQQITRVGINQTPDMYIDLNDVIHLTWSSNRDTRWEVYYAKSLTSFDNTRITDYPGKSLRPRIDGNKDGKIFITWHDNRFGTYEIMLAYYNGERILPLLQQDPYLASLGNAQQGWTHVGEIIPFTMTNLQGESRCYSEIIAKFFTDRNLEKEAFQVKSSEYPFAFTIGGAQSDTVTSEFSTLAGWTVTKSVGSYDGAGVPEALVNIAVSPEIDCFLLDSELTSMQLPSIDPIYATLSELSVRASNTSTETAAWSPAVSISGMEGTTVSLSDLGISETYRKGRFKQVRVKYEMDVITDGMPMGDGTYDAELDSVGGVDTWTSDETAIVFGNTGTTKKAYLRGIFPIGMPEEIIQSRMFLTSTGSSASSLAEIELLDYDDTPAFGSTTTYTQRVNGSTSDNYLSNGVNVGGLTDAAIQVGGANISMLRFPLNVPKTAIISEAKITVKSSGNYSNSGVTANVRLVNNKDCDAFTTPEVSVEIPVASSSDDMFIRMERTGPSDATAYKWEWTLDWSTLRVSKTSYLSYEVLFDSFARFNVSSVPSNATVVNATLSFDVTSSTAAPSPQVQIRALDQADVAAFVAPGNTTTPSPGVRFEEVTAVIPNSPGSASVDITSLYQAWATHGGSGHFAVRLRSAAMLTHTLDSYESLNPPKLTLLYRVNQTTTSSSVAWNISSQSWSTGSSYDSIDITTLVNEWLTMQDAGYTTGNYFGLLLEGVGSEVRSFESYDKNGNGTSGAILTVKYISTSFTGTGKKVSWTTGAWSGDTEYSADITTLMREYQNRPGFVPNKIFGLRIVPQSATEKSFYSYDNAYHVPRFEISYGYQPTDWVLKFTSTTKARLCLSPGQSMNGTLDMSPVVRIDATGNSSTSTPIPVDWIKNQAYFVGLYGKEEGGDLDYLGDQKRSVSCESCFENEVSWSYTSCSLPIRLSNNGTISKYYDLRVRFYADAEKGSPVAEYCTLDPFDLQCFSLDNAPAATQWGEKGLPLPGGNAKTVLLWPKLSPRAGLLCGISYYVEVATCVKEDVDPPCKLDEFVATGPIQKWVCSCESARWDNVYEDAPVNLHNIRKWVCSGMKGSDTRITETLSNNYNPVIKIRENLQGVVVYESDRKSLLNPDSDARHLYASVFSVVPTMNAYASSSEAIDTPFEQLIHRSDMEICANAGCYTEHDGTYTRTTNEHLAGSAAAIDIDQYDNLFLAAERLYSYSECTDLAGNKQKSILVHRCGANANDLVFSRTTTAEPGLPDTCTQEGILGKTFTPESDLKLQTVVRVKPEFVNYHIFRMNEYCPVVSKCNLQLEIVGPSGSVAVRVRNGTKGTWSKWIPFEKIQSNNSMSIDHTIEKGSGVKTVQCQLATVAGLTSTVNLSIVADYDRVNFSVKLYRGGTGAPRPPALPVNGWETDNSIWSEANLLSTYNGLPVASVRQTETVQTADYIYVEIIPETSYMQQFASFTAEQKSNPSASNVCISPSFDLIQQGGYDLFGVQTKYVLSDSIERFRGYIPINREDFVLFRDGLATIVPHFVNDCSDAKSSGVSCSEASLGFVRDSYNVFGTKTDQSASEGDVWVTERDEVGKVEYAATIRGLDDPYFVFGDPNYRLGNNEG